MKIFLFIFVSLQYASETMNSQHICKFSLLPLDIQNHIASYLCFANNAFECDQFFIERLQQSNGLQKRERISRGEISVSRNGKYKYWKINKINVSVKANIKFSVQYFTSSSTNNYMVTIARDSTEFFSTRDAVELFRFNNSNYISQWSNNSNRFTSIHGLAVSNNGQVAIVKNDGGCYTVNLLSENEDIEKFKLSLKYNSNNYLCWVIRIVDVLFNKQSTKIGIKKHFLYEALHNETTVNELAFRKLLKQWFISNYTKKYAEKMSQTQYTKILELLEKPTVKHREFWDTLKSIINDDDFMLKINEKMQAGNADFCPITLIEITQKEHWTLAKYFKLRGVCQSLNKQCGFKE